MHFHSPQPRSESPIDLRQDTQAFLLSEFVDVNAALRDISLKARVLTDATGVAIALAHKSSMICRASSGNAPSLGSRLDITSGFSGECVRTGKALRCDDSESDPRVDVASCRRLGIRSIVAIPIRVGHQTVGLMEVFSPRPNAFGDWHVSVLRRLVNSPLLSSRTAAPTPPELMLEIEPANRALVDKTAEVFSERETVVVNSTSAPAQFWPDVFVPNALPWKRFAQSLGLHLVMIAGLAGFVRLGLEGPHAVQPKFNSADVLYYSSFEYFGHKRQKLAARVKTHRGELPEEQVIAVPREPSRRTEKSVSAPEIKLKSDKRELPSLAWSSVSPSIPASAIVRKHFISPTTPVSVVAPAPDVSGVGSRRSVASPRTAVIEPPPSVETASGQLTDISIAALQVVGPPPEINNDRPNSKALAVQSSLHDDLAAVVAPSPSLDGIHLPSAGARGRPAVGAVQVVPPPPQVSGTGNSRRHASLHDDPTSAIGPSPSLEGTRSTGAQARGWVAAGAAQVVPPPPEVSGTGNSWSWTQPTEKIAVVSPPPSLRELGGNAAGVMSARHAAGPNLVPLPPKSDEAGGGGALNRTKSNVLPPMDEDISGDSQRTDRKELSIAPIAPAAALASSSYFASSEIFIAEERVGVHRRRYIKLVYDYLPYQKRLSEYGPKYPEVDKLRATRDVSCDEDLAAGAYFIGQAVLSRSNGSAQPQDVAVSQDSLPCFRTTADDYRRALAHHPKSHSAQ